MVSQNQNHCQKEGKKKTGIENSKKGVKTGEGDPPTVEISGRVQVWRGKKTLGAA